MEFLAKTFYSVEDDLVSSLPNISGQSISVMESGDWTIVCHHGDHSHRKHTLTLDLKGTLFSN